MVFWRPHCRRCRRILRSLFRPATEKSEVWVWYTLSRGIWWRKGPLSYNWVLIIFFWIRKVSFWPVRKRIGIYTPFFFDNLWSLNFVEWWRFAEDIKWGRENKPRKKQRAKKSYNTSRSDGQMSCDTRGPEHWNTVIQHWWISKVWLINVIDANHRRVTNMNWQDTNSS